MDAGMKEALGGVERESDVAIPMRDGTRLRADVYRPVTDEPLPVIMLRTPYDKRLAQTIVYRHPAWLARHGYLVVVVDVRGRYGSEGAFDPLRHEGTDGYDAIEWAARLPGTTGKVGTYGFSYPGAVQLLAAIEQPPSLACMAVGFTGWDYYSNWVYNNGAFSLAFILSWTLEYLHPADLLKAGREADAQALRNRLARDGIGSFYKDLPLRDNPAVNDIPYLREWLDHDTRDEYWRQIELVSRLERIQVPCLHIGGWYDSFPDGTVRLFEELDRLAAGDEARAQHLVMGPWQHIPWARHVGIRDFGPDAGNFIDDLQVRWFNRWLKGAREDWAGEPKARIFAMGANEWRSEDGWPPKRTSEKRVYLHSSGDAQSLSGGGSLSDQPPSADQPPDVFVFVPADPVPSLGGRSCCDPASAPIGPYDHRMIETRNDILVYSTEPLAEPLEICGPVEIVLHAATDAVDTDWTAKLLDVDPEGRAINLCDGIVRARFRDSVERPQPLEPGAIYEYRFLIGSVANRFMPGHRIRLEISSSNFPMYDVNPNTGARVLDADPSTGVTATQSVFHDPQRSSHLILPVVAPA